MAHTHAHAHAPGPWSECRTVHPLYSGARSPSRGPPRWEVQDILCADEAICALPHFLVLKFDAGHGLHIAMDPGFNHQTQSGQ